MSGCAPLPPSGPGAGRGGQPGTATSLPSGGAATAPRSSGTGQASEREVRGAYTSGSTASGARAGADAAPGEGFDGHAVPDAVPIDEPRSRYGNKSPYTVFGKSYKVMDDATGYNERGLASWYGAKFHGAKTSSGEIYDMHAMSAAHKTLPLPSYVRVTNLETGATVIVRVNDRGPFKDNRVIDLSYAAAMRLGITAKGTGLVEVSVVGPGDVSALPAGVATAAPPKPLIAPLTAEDMALVPPEPPAASPDPMPRVAVASTAAPVTPRVMWLQVGAFGDDANANRVRARLAAAGLSSTTVEESDASGKRLVKIRVGPFQEVVQLDAAATALDAMDLRQHKTVIE
jgi:rare lipoprotein A